MPARVEVPLKFCLSCGMPMFRKRYGRNSALEQPSRYAARKVCGARCLGMLMRKPVGKMAAKECRQCGTPIKRKVFPCGSKETRTQLKIRKFCDAECAGLYADERGLRIKHLNLWRHRRNVERLRSSE